MATTYPPVPTTLSGDVESINRYMNNPTAISRDMRTLAQQRYISDFLLKGRYTVQGGAVLYETGESIFAADDPRPVTPAGEYPLVVIPDGAASLVSTTNWGQDTFVTDAAIARRLNNPVIKARIKLVNTNVKYVDSVTLAVIASAVTNGTNAAASWATATAKQILTDVMLAKANIVALNMGYDPDVVAVDDINFAYAMSTLAAAGFLPREGTNPIITGNWPIIDGMTWVTTPNIPTAGVAIVADSNQLGGMADEDLGGPGYSRAPNGVGIQVKSIREDVEDRWRLRARRVVVPVVNEPAAARKITSL